MEAIATPNGTTNNNNNNKPFTMFPRVWTTAEAVKSQGTRFTICTYNLLTDVCVPDGEYLYCPEECRYMKARHPRILTELRTMNPDVVCLQEVDVDHWEGMLEKDMASLGYKGVYFVSRLNQGLAVFYKTDKFRLLEEQHWRTPELADKMYIEKAAIGNELKDDIRKAISRANLSIMVKLQHVISGDVISVANVHISWAGLKYPALQALQISTITNELVRFAGGADKPHLICGDFNTPPDFPAYHMLTSSRLTPEAKSALTRVTVNCLEEDTMGARELVDHLPEAFVLGTDFKSAYKSVLNKEPPITNCDDCGMTERTNLCLDYFWFSQQSLEVAAVLETPSPEDIMRHYAIPSVLFPSDHISLKAEFVFKQ